MKNYGLLKVGYSHGYIGCTNEYFTCVYSDDRGLHNFSFSGMYGVNERVQKAMEAQGFIYNYISSDYGLIKIRKAWKGFKSENEALEYIKNDFE